MSTHTFPLPKPLFGGSSTIDKPQSKKKNSQPVADQSLAAALPSVPAMAPAQVEKDLETSQQRALPSDTELAAEVEPRPIDPAKAAFLKVLQRAKEGDKAAFEEIFQLYHRRIYNAVYGMLSDADDAQDVTQDVFMRLHDALPTLRADEAFSTYLYRIALNLCRDRARRKKRVRFQSIDTPRVDSEGDVEPMDFPDVAKLPEETMTNDELQKARSSGCGHAVRRSSSRDCDAPFSGHGSQRYRQYLESAVRYGQKPPGARTRSIAPQITYLSQYVR